MLYLILYSSIYLELEIDEWLYLRTLHLHNDEYNDSNHDSREDNPTLL